MERNTKLTQFWSNRSMWPWLLYCQQRIWSEFDHHNPWWSCFVLHLYHLVKDQWNQLMRYISLGRCSLDHWRCSYIHIWWYWHTGCNRIYQESQWHQERMELPRRVRKLCWRCWIYLQRSCLEFQNDLRGNQEQEVSGTLLTDFWRSLEASHCTLSFDIHNGFLKVVQNP